MNTTKSIDHDEVPQYVAFHLGLRCLLKSLVNKGLTASAQLSSNSQNIRIRLRFRKIFLDIFNIVLLMGQATYKKEIKSVMDYVFIYFYKAIYNTNKHIMLCRKKERKKETFKQTTHQAKRLKHVTIGPDKQIFAA